MVRMRSEVVGQPGDEGGDATLHVAGAAAEQRPVPHHAGEGVVGPGRSVAGRHDVGMPGVAEMRPGGAAPGEQVVHPVIVRAEDQPRAGEAERFQHPLHDVQRAVIGGRDRPAADHRLGEGKRIRCHGAVSRAAIR